jgi:hypothetical protein
MKGTKKKKKMSCWRLKGPVNQTLNHIEFYQRLQHPSQTPPEVHEGYAKEQCRLLATGRAFSVTTLPGTGHSVCSVFGDLPYVSDVQTIINIDGASKTVFCQF